MMLRQQQRLIATFLAVLLANAAPADERPNILLILTDDQGYADVGFNGGRDVRTPNLDELAANGMTFTQAYVPHPFCGPSRAGLMTGRYPHKIGAQFNLPSEGSNLGVPRTEVFISKVLQDAGYFTGAIGKWHLGEAPEFHPNERGFDTFYGFLGGGHNYYPEQFTQAYNAQLAAGNTHIWEYLRPLEHNGAEVEETEYVTDGLSREAVNFVLEAADREEPFFLYLAYNAPHTPLEAKDDDLALFMGIEDENRRTYAAMVYAVDRGVGDVVDALRDTGQLDSTLIVFLSDNGGRLDRGGNNFPLREGKGTVHEGGYRSPMFMHWPERLSAGATFEHPVLALDFYPTFAGLADAVIPADRTLDGRDIWQDIVSGQDPHDGEFLYVLRHHKGFSDAAVRRDHWKAVKTGSQPWKLFNIEEDIGEHRDLSAQNPAVLANMVREMERWSWDNAEPGWFHISQEGVEWREHAMPRFHETFAVGGATAQRDPDARREPPAAATTQAAAATPPAIAQRGTMTSGVLPLSDPNNSGGWILNERFSDEFEGAELDRDKWIVQGEGGRYYTWRGRAPAQFAPHNVLVEDGMLKLRSQWEPDFDFHPEPHNGFTYGEYEGEPMPVTAAAVISRDRFMHGYMEVRTRAADAAVTSAFWAIGHQSEIDVYEQLGRPKRQGNIRDNYYMFSIYDWRPPVVRPNKVWTHTHELPFRVADEFHVYGCEWDDEVLRFYLDGELVREVTREEVGERWTLTNPMELWFDKEIFEWLGVPHEEELPADYEIDYVRVWQKPQPSLIDRSFFGFEGPMIFPEFRPTLGEPRQQGWTDTFAREWFMDNQAQNYLSISEQRRVTGRKSLKFESDGRLGPDAVSAFSPWGSVALPAGEFVLAMNVWIEPGSTVRQLHVVFENPWQDVTFPLQNVDQGSWVTIYQRLNSLQPSAPDDRLRVSFRKNEVGNGPSAVFVDNLLLIRNPEQ